MGKLQPHQRAGDETAWLGGIMKGNMISYYDENFPYKDKEYYRPHFVFAIKEEIPLWHFATFYSYEQLESYCKLFDIPFVFDKDKKEGWTEKHLRHDETPSDYRLIRRAKPYWGLSNGSIVENRFVSTENEVIFYLTNPNDKEHYKPLSLEDTVKFIKEKGIY